MARTEAFARLRRLAAMALWGERRGIRDPEALRAAWAGEGAGLSRRDLLRSGGAAAALLAAGCPPIRDSSSESESEGAAVQPRIVIVGAGLAGLHCAYRLKESGVRAIVYEAWNRSGGRMISTGEGIPDDMVIELGGEFIDSDQPMIRGLVTEFGLTLDDRLADLPVDHRLETWWIDGAMVTDDELLAEFMLIAPTIAVLAGSAAKDPTTFAQLDAQSLQKWLDVNIPATTYPALNPALVATYRGEYGLEPAKQSALNLLLLIDADAPDRLRLRGDGDRRYHIHGGSERLVKALRAELDDDQVVLDRQLVGARDGHAGAFLLTFMSTGGAMEEVEADHVVFALPFSTLRLCDLSALTLSEEKREIIAELGYGTHTRMVGVFTAPIWRTTYNASGAATTDLALQMCWDSAVGQGGAAGLLTEHLGGDAGLKAGMGAAEEWYGSTVVPGIEAIFPGAEAAYVAGSAVRMHWPSAPFHKGSFTCYRPGQWAFHGRQGVREGNLHFCGEHCSLYYQGRMEGAAESGGLVAAELLDDVAMTLSAPLRELVALSAAAGGHPCYHGDRRARWALAGR